MGVSISSAFVRGVRLGVRGVVLVVCVCVSVSGVLFSVGACVCDLLIFLHLGQQQLSSRKAARSAGGVCCGPCRLLCVGGGPVGVRISSLPGAAGW